MSSKFKSADRDRQLLHALQGVREARETAAKYPPAREDWLDAMMYGLLFGTPDEIYRMQVHAKKEAEEAGRPFTPVFWTATEVGAEPVLTLWRIK
jgi:hypothetical protein